MITDAKHLEAYPEIMSKEQFYKACHISKRMAEYVLKSGLVPCKHKNKQTHSYLIQKSDVLAFIKDRAENPSKYVIPPSFDKRERKYEPVFLSFGFTDRSVVTSYYTNLLKIYPEVLDVAFVSGFTGYNRKTVRNWIKNGHLKCFGTVGAKQIVLKDALLNFLASDYYNQIHKKSYGHIRHLKTIMNEHQTKSTAT